ncbi:MAG: hypothetical protein ACXWQR_20105 [Ktedonobacterales bacterium]
MTSGASNLPDAAQDPAAAARAAILQLAQRARANGEIYSAVHLYDHLLQEYPRTQESRRAAEEMLALARFLETQGMYHTALSFYERLEQLQ